MTASRLKMQSGFTLIEIMVAVVIIGILSAIAFPTYTAYVERGWRASARTVLLDGAQFMERSRAANFVYPTGDVLPDTMKVAPKEGTARYNISLTEDSGDASFTLQAEPTNWTDALCGTLTIDHRGIKGHGGSGSAKDCWGR